MAVAADVPGKFDVVINGEGYMFAEMEDTKAQYGYTPTFAQRLSLQGDYGDNQQDFWLTLSQRDWSLGEGQKFFRTTEGRERRYWEGNACDVTTIAGQVKLLKAKRDFTFAQGIGHIVPRSDAIAPDTDQAIAVGSSNAYTVDIAGTATSLGAHGVTPLDSPFGIAADGGGDVYFSANGLIRKISDAGVFSDFSVTSSAKDLAYLNNTLYGFVSGLGLVRYDTAGARTTIFQWQGADGVAWNTKGARIKAYGSKLVGTISASPTSFLWLYDGTAPAVIMDLPLNFSPCDMASVNGVLFISGVFTRAAGSSSFHMRPAILYYSNGTTGVLWQAADYNTSITTSSSWTGGIGPAMAPWGNGIAFVYNHGSSDTRLLAYDMASGGVSTLATFAFACTFPSLINYGGVLLWCQAQSTAGHIYPDIATTASTGFITSSLFDFDSSLDKIFRGIKIEYDEGSDGDGGSIDIAYRVNDVDGSYTTLQTGAVSGTEYTLSNITGRSISVKLTLNKGTSTNGPVLKRVQVRAVPQQVAGTGAAFRKDTFLINCTGRDGEAPLRLRDGTLHAKDGLTMASELRTAATTTFPISITDEFGTFTGVVENEGFQLRRVRTNEFIAVVPVREV